MEARIDAASEMPFQAQADKDLHHFKLSTPHLRIPGQLSILPEMAGRQYGRTIAGTRQRIFRARRPV
jgi:hypothetical protein